MDGPDLAEKMFEEWKGAFSELKKKLPADVFEKQMKAWGEPEPLDFDLACCLYEDEHFGPIVKHPLVFSIPYIAQDNPRLNKWYEWKNAKLLEYAHKRDYSGYIYAHERPYRIDACIEIFDEFETNACERWTCLRIAWMDTENSWQHYDDWVRLFRENYADGREFFMTSEDQQEWAMLSDDEPVPVYRGFSVDGGERGLSWTTDKIRAKYFARRFAQIGHRGKARLAIGRVMKRDCIGYLNGRNESEVVVFPENVDLIRVGEVPTK